MCNFCWRSEKFLRHNLYTVADHRIPLNNSPVCPEFAPKNTYFFFKLKKKSNAILQTSPEQDPTQPTGLSSGEPFEDQRTSVPLLIKQNISSLRFFTTGSQSDRESETRLQLLVLSHQELPFHPFGSDLHILSTYNLTPIRNHGISLTRQHAFVTDVKRAQDTFLAARLPTDISLE